MTCSDPGVAAPTNVSGKHAVKYASNTWLCIRLDECNRYLALEFISILHHIFSASMSNSAKSVTDAANPVKWYRSTFFNMTILGLCNFAAPGIWGAMNSLGAGGAQKPYLVNTANALTFCLMVVSCLFSSALVKLIGIKGALIFGTYVSQICFSGCFILTALGLAMPPTQPAYTPTTVSGPNGL